MREFWNERKENLLLSLPIFTFLFLLLFLGQTWKVFASVEWDLLKKTKASSSRERLSTNSPFSISHLPLNSSVLLAVIWPGFDLGRSGWTSLYNGVYPCTQINNMVWVCLVWGVVFFLYILFIFFPTEQAIAIWLEWLTEEVFGCAVVAGMKLLK